MPTRHNLAVVIDDGRGGGAAGHRVASSKVSGLKFRRVAQGGDHSCSFLLTDYLENWKELGPVDVVHLDDATTGERMFTGYTENPERITRGGERIDITAVGGMSRAQDENRALLYVSRVISDWNKTTSSAVPASAVADIAPHPLGAVGAVAGGIRTQFSPGQPITAGHRAMTEFEFPDGMEFGAASLIVAGGKTDALYNIMFNWTTGEFAINTLQAADIPQQVFNLTAGIPAGVTKIGLALYRNGGATNIADDLTWAYWYLITVLGRRMDRHGTLVVGSAGMSSAAQVLANQVVEDLVGRLLTFCDPVTASIEATGTAIDQLAFMDGTTAAGVLDALSLWEPDFLWSVGPMQLNGKHPFTYRSWTTTPRYEVGNPLDFVKLSAGEITLCNRIQVYWNEPSGRRESLTVTSVVPALDERSRTKDAPSITLPEGKGSAANAQRIGEQILATMAGPTRGGTAVVRRRIFDNVLRREVDPWNIQPGYLVQIRDTGETLRLTEVEYDDDSVSATLTLGEPTLTMEQRVAKLSGGIVA